MSDEYRTINEQLKEAMVEGRAEDCIMFKKLGKKIFKMKHIESLKRSII